MERVRYKKLVNNRLESKNVFIHPSNGAQYKVVLNLEENQWKVLDANTDLVAQEGESLTKAGLQKDVRKALVSLGISLSQEKRAARTKSL